MLKFNLKSEAQIEWIALMVIALFGFASLCVNLHAWYAVRPFYDVDPDPMWRILRLEQLMQTWDWYNFTTNLTHPVAGGFLHWTRCLDILLMIFAYPLQFFMSLRLAIEISTMAWSVILWTSFALSLQWWLKAAPLSKLGQIGATLTILWFMTQGAVFALGHGADHHAHLAVLFVLLMGFMTRILRDLELELKSQKSHAVMVGVIGVVGTWIAIEFILPYVLSLLALSLVWLWKGKREAWQGVCHASLAAAVLSFPIFFIENAPSHWLIFDHDKFSLLHVIVFVLAVTVAFGISYLKESWSRSISQRIWILLGAGVAAAIVLLLTDNSFFSGPIAETDPFLGIVRYGATEMYPYKISFNNVSYAGMALFFLTPALFLILNTHLNDKKFFWIYIFLMLSVTFIMTLKFSRWYRYSLVPLSFCAACSYAYFFTSDFFKRGWQMKSVLWAGVMTGYCALLAQQFLRNGDTVLEFLASLPVLLLYFTILAWLFQKLLSPASRYHKFFSDFNSQSHLWWFLAFTQIFINVILIDVSSSYLVAERILKKPIGAYASIDALTLSGALNAVMPQKGMVFANDDGGNFSYGLGYPAIIGKYHRNIQGICDSYNLYYAVNEKAVKEIIKKYDTKYLLLKTSDFSIPKWDKHLLKRYSSDFPNTDIVTPHCTFHTDSFRDGGIPFLKRVLNGEIAVKWLVPINYARLSLGDSKPDSPAGEAFVNKLFRVDFKRQ